MHFWRFRLELHSKVGLKINTSIKGCSAFLVWGSQGSTLASLHIMEKCCRRTEALEMVFIVSWCCLEIKAQMLQVHLCRAGPGLNAAVAKKIGDRSFAFWTEGARTGMALGGREPALVCSLVVMPVTMNGLRDARVSRNLGDGSALQIWRMDVAEDVVDLSVAVHVIAAFHNPLEGGDHRENEIINDQCHKPRI
jgi:hypothetical protein